MARKPSTNSKPSQQTERQSGDTAPAAADVGALSASVDQMAAGTSTSPAGADAGEKRPAGSQDAPIGADAGAKQPEGEPAAPPVAGPTQAIPLDLVRSMAQEGASIFVTGPAGGRWRAGRHFGPTATPVPLAELTDEEIVAILADPFLSHSLVQIEEPEAQ